MDRALDYGSRGWGFESLLARPSARWLTSRPVEPIFISLRFACENVHVFATGGAAVPVAGFVTGLIPTIIFMTMSIYLQPSTLLGG